MVPLLGGAFSACVYHFFYNSPKLDALVALQVTSLPTPCLSSVCLSFHVTNRCLLQMLRPCYALQLCAHSL